MLTSFLRFSNFLGNPEILRRLLNFKRTFKLKFLKIGIEKGELEITKKDFKKSETLQDTQLILCI